MTRVKICCIQSLEEAELALDAGAAAVGLVGAMPSGPGPIPDARIAAIADALRPRGAMSVLLTAETQPAALIDHVRRCRPAAVQLVDTVVARVVAELRAAVPDVTVIQVVHVNGPSSREQALLMADHADMLLLDSGSPDKAVKELGGTGRTHDWRISAEIVRESPVPVWLAGGLRPDNVAQAIRQVRPHGVDVCSSLRDGIALDPGRLKRFLAEAAGA